MLFSPFFYIGSFQRSYFKPCGEELSLLNCYSLLLSGNKQMSVKLRNAFAVDLLVCEYLGICIYPGVLPHGLLPKWKSCNYSYLWKLFVRVKPRVLWLPSRCPANTDDDPSSSCQTRTELGFPLKGHREVSQTKRASIMWSPIEMLLPWLN